MAINPWVPFGGALTYNVYCHMTGKPTMCSTAREYVPAVVMVAGWCILTDWLIPHYVDGFKVEFDRLTG